jgi:hypothetical protein
MAGEVPRRAGKQKDQNLSPEIKFPDQIITASSQPHHSLITA